MMGGKSRFCVTTKAEVHVTLVRIKTFRNWEFKQTVAFVSALGRERIA